MEDVEVDDQLGLFESFKGVIVCQAPVGLPRFNGGLVVVGYDVRYIGQRLAPAQTLIHWLRLMFYCWSDAVVVFDNLSGKLHLIVLVDRAGLMPISRACELELLNEQLRKPLTPRLGWT